MTWAHLERGSSPVDWCEGNYLISSEIAEFTNTISNILFLLLPPILIHLFKEYARFINPAIHLIWIFFIVVGLSSAYFHATLSLIGQLLDELAILWVCASGFAMFYPRKMYPKFMQGNRKYFGTFISMLAIAATALSIWKPFVNAFVLMLIVIPSASLLHSEVKATKCQRARRLGFRSMAFLMVALFCWINDRMFCETWSAMNFPYLHGLWHIFIFFATYPSCVLFAFFSAQHEYADRTPVLKYWPRNDFEFGIPYVTAKCATSSAKDYI